VQKLAAQIELAETQLRSAQVELAAIAGKAADDLVLWATGAGDGRQQPKTPQARDQQEAEGKVALATHHLVHARAALVKATIPLDEAKRKVSELQSGTLDLLLNVLADEGVAAIHWLAETRRETATATARARALAAMLSSRGRERQARNAPPETVTPLFKLVEKILMMLDTVPSSDPSARELGDEESRWAELMDSLATDATARLKH
jgi:hypothetical protein